MNTLNIPVTLKPLLRRIGSAAERQGVSAYAVGGCVRDWRLGRPAVKDLDVTVEADGPAIAREMIRTMGGTLRVHPQFGTATIVLSGGRGRRVDIATCRKETYAKPAAYPRVDRGTLEEDLCRRDFTINAMAVALNPGRFGALIDPFGGIQDLAARRLRVLHPHSFEDDPSRILRGIRFAQRFGCRFESSTERALRRALNAGALGWLNAGRLNREFERMLREPDPLACFRSLTALLERAPRGG